MPNQRRKLRNAASLTGSALVSGSSGNMQLRTLGHSGDEVSVVGMCGSRTGQQNNEQESIRITRNHFDATAKHFEWLG